MSDISDLIFKHFGWFLLLAASLLLYSTFIASNEKSNEKFRLMKQCMADGKKEYECRAMLDDHNQNTYVPVVIPVGR